MTKRKVSIEDLLQFKFVSSVALSPDERRVLFTVSTMSEDKKKYHSHLYMIDSDGSNLRQYTFGDVSDSNPTFSPDGKWIAFVSKRGEKKGIYKIPSDGGEAKLLVDADGSFSDISFSPDGRRLLCTFTRADDVPKNKEGKKEEPVYRHVTRLFYKLDNAGYLPQDRGHIHVYDFETGKGTRLGKMKNGERLPVWFPDGRQIAFVSNVQRDPDLESLCDEVFVMSASGGRVRRLTKPAGPVAGLSISPDGKQIAYIGHAEPDDAWGVANFHVWKIDLRTGKAVDLMPKYDRMTVDMTISDMAESHGLMNPQWSPDGRQIFFIASDSGSTILCSVSASGGRIAKVIGGKLHVAASSMAPKCKLVAAAISTPTMPAEVHISSAVPNGKPQRITFLNSDFEKSVDLRKPREVIVRGHDGYPIHGWIITPPGFVPTRKYPSILEIHGGPRVQYGFSFFHEMQFLAAQGYVVYYCNPRGGQGYGRRHAECIVGKWGTVDYEDCMSMARHMASQPYINPKKMGVTGGSYGGYMTNWIVGHTTMFKAAVTQRSVTNFISMYGSSDVGFDLVRELKGSPYKDLERWWEMSPIKHVRKVRTPLLVVHSENDLRCPIEQGEQLYIALKMLGRKVEMVRFPNEPHGLSRCGRPDRREARLQWFVKWFDRYLKGKK